MGKLLKKVTHKRQRNWFENHRKSLRPGCTYDPFWRTEDIPSSGVKEKLPYFKNGNRVVHLLSQNEVWMYLHLTRHPLLLSIHEQYAIPLAYSLVVAKRLKVKHPVYIGTRTPIVQTIDFVVDMLNAETGEVYQLAIAVKNEDKQELRIRTEEKLAIQEAYAAVKSMRYQLVTGSEIRTTYSCSLEILYRYRDLSEYLLNLGRSWLANFFGVLSDNRHERVAHLIDLASSSTGCDSKLGISFFYHALWHKRILIDWSQHLKLETPASDLGVMPND